MNYCPACAKNDATAYSIIKSEEVMENLYEDITLLRCSNCGHIFNHLEDSEKQALEMYYKTDYTSVRSLNGTKINNKAGNASQGQIRASQDRINDYLDLLIEMNTKNMAKKRKTVYLDQFLEHCWNLDKVMANIVQAEPEDIYLSLPLAEQYYQIADIPYFYLIKEHVQHFSVQSITALLERYGFTVQKIKKSMIKITDKIEMPNMEVYACKKAEEDIYAYGTTREFLYMLKNNPAISGMNIKKVFDDTKIKQGKTVAGIVIAKPNQLNKLPKRSKIIIASISNFSKIAEAIAGSGYRGKVVDFIN